MWHVSYATPFPRKRLRHCAFHSSQLLTKRKASSGENFNVENFKSCLAISQEAGSIFKQWG